eukprot:scaffold69267_cov66-Phaeocystis_antarctica.AAC.2
MHRFKTERSRELASRCMRCQAKLNSPPKIRLHACACHQRMDSGGQSGAPGAAAQVLAAMVEAELPQPPQPPLGQADLQQQHQPPPPPPPQQQPAQQQQGVGTPQRAPRDISPPTAVRPLAVANLWQDRVTEPSA